MRLSIEPARLADLNDTVRHAVELEALDKTDIKLQEDKCYLRATNRDADITDTSFKTVELLKIMRSIFLKVLFG